jgi:hypothetical protein
LASEHYIQELLDLQWYNFVAVTKWWEESMAVLKLFHNDHVDYADLNILKSKASGRYG